MSSELLSEVLRDCGFNSDISRIHLLSRGKGCLLYRLDNSEQPLFIKLYPEEGFDQVKAEADGLRALRKNPYTSAPEVQLETMQKGISILAMDFIQSSAKGRNLAMRDFGRQLAGLHKFVNNSAFGYRSDTYIGSLKQDNRVLDTWEEFYFHRRLKPQIQMAVKNKLLPSGLVDKPEQWIRTIKVNCPNEKACLTHGDLWSGNMIATEDGKPFLIDPAVSYTHREMDLAMTQLFGGFSADFYHAYEEIWPLHPAFNSRVQIYQLYYLLVHVNLFGSSYTAQTMSVINRYFA